MNTQQPILVVEDDDALREALGDTLELAGYAVTSVRNGREALAQLADIRPQLILSDVQMPEMDGLELLKTCRAQHPDAPFVLMTAFGDVEIAVDAMRRGAADFLAKPFEADALLALVEKLTPDQAAADAPVFEDASSHSVAELALRVAQSDASIVISGESGVGKEVFARLIHDHSNRASQPFVAINCAAIPESMLESILFGYEKGAFTGAHTARPGKFEHANGGTLLLDEISEMDLGLQAKLLRVLQEREVERLGGKQPLPLDIRVLATTNRDLAAEVAAGNFREDLFYRLNVFPLHIPPLRERRGDILPMCRRFMQEMAPGEGLALDSFAEELLMQYHWPGNVRELHNVVQRALILRNGQTVDATSILFEPGTPAADEVAGEAPLEETGEAALVDDLKIREMELIINTLNAENGSRKDAAARLGISPRTLRYKLARFREQGVSIPGAASA
ncbi:MAG: sigma-54 dependent transcriptional regulator [Halieaceae bacterium]|nr:sigma-54 dependent transcriptional regulator [Halieaceae bacterium]